jgi:hypothetical protein
LLGGPIIAGATLSRFFAMHVFVIPGLLIAFVTLHVLLVLKLGINEWPMPGRIVRRDTYLRDYGELVHRDGEPFVPYAVWKDILFSGVILLSIGACALLFGPFGPGGQPDPTIIQTAPRPDFFFLWLYAVLSFLPPAAETPLLMIGPVIAIALLLGLPFFAGEGEKSWRRRPVAVLTILLTAVALGAFTQLGEHTPWSPVMDAWSGDPIPSQYLVRRTALERRGALVLQAKQCRNCHSLDGLGGKRGPALDTVAVRLTPSQLIRQVIQGGGNMPAYGKNLNPAETTAIVAFLETLHPAGQPPARDASNEVALGVDADGAAARRPRMATEPTIASIEVETRDPVRSYTALVDYWALTKPEVNSLIAVTTFAGFYLGYPIHSHHFPFALLIHTLLGTLLVASGTGTLNQYFERCFDAQMRRTARRPISRRPASASSATTTCRCCRRWSWRGPGWAPARPSSPSPGGPGRCISAPAPPTSWDR